MKTDDLKKPNRLSGSYIMFNGEYHIFLGYSDYARKWLVIADRHGNKKTIHYSQLYQQW
jgi:hypothetical protein